MCARLVAAALFVITASGAPALGWGHQGHEVVGSIADRLLNPNARQQVEDILGFKLRVAAPWLDCVRSVVRHSDDSFEYAPSKEEFRIPCKSFETKAEKARMVDYAARNWHACVREGDAACQNTFHFAD